MENLKVGHYTKKEDGTGATVFLFDQPSAGAYTLCGSAPASHELHTLELDAIVSADGLVFVGGSAFGLTAVEGAVRWFKEQRRGYPTSHGFIPIVPAAAIYDLAVTKPMAPTTEHVYQACLTATQDNISYGRIGAGTGASVGKLVSSAKRMTGGLGHAILKLTTGVSVEAYAVVNSVGDVLDAQGKIIAGARFADGDFANCTDHLLSGQQSVFHHHSNTTLIAVFTNALFTKNGLKRISKMAIAGIARAISPAFTSHDGDIVFCFSLGDYANVSEDTIGTMAAEAIRQAILHAVEDSVCLYP